MFQFLTQKSAEVTIPVLKASEGEAAMQALHAIGTEVQALRAEVAGIKSATADEAITALKAEHAKQLSALQAENESLKAKITSLESQPAATRVVEKAAAVTESATVDEKLHPFTALAAEKLKKTK